jgi:uncharacterized protein DUF6640
MDLQEKAGQCRDSKREQSQRLGKIHTPRPGMGRVSAGSMVQRVGRVLMGIVAIITIFAPIAADFNESHIFNPVWPPHARFHGAMSVAMGVGLGVVTLWLLIRPSRDRALALRAAAWTGALYWLSFFPAVALRGTAPADPGHTLPHPLGIPFNLFLAILCTVVTAVGYAMASRDPR